MSYQCQSNEIYTTMVWFLDLVLFFQLLLLHFFVPIIIITGSNVTPLASAINKMQIGRRHTLAADGQTMVPITNALTSKVRVMISPLQDKRRHTFVAPAIMRSARKAIDHAQKVTEQLRGSSSVPQVEVAKEDIAVTKGQQTRTPLKPVNPKVSQKQNEDRAASTPAGNECALI